MLNTHVGHRLGVEPVEHFFSSGCVDYDAKTLGQAINNKIVEDAAVSIERRTVKRLILCKVGNIVSDHLAQKGFGVRAIDINNGHMRHVEHAGIGSNCRVFFNL